MDMNCNMFGIGGIFGNAASGSNISDTKLSEILNGYHILIPTGDSTTIETLTKIDGGTAQSEDVLSFFGGSSFD